MGRDEDLHALLPAEGLLLLDDRSAVDRLRLLRQLVGPLRLPAGAAQPEAHVHKGVLLVLFQQHVHVIGQDLDLSIPEYVPHQVRHRLEPGAHIPVPAEIADPGDQDAVAPVRQRGRVA